MSTSDIVRELEERLYYNGEINQIQLIEQTGLISQIASIVLGVLSIVILILVPIVVAVEVIYIAFPVIRNKTDELILKIESKGVKHNALGFVLRDAKEAVKRANIDMIGQKSAISIYLKLKVKSVFIGMFILAFVIQGGSDIVEFLWDMFEGLVSTMFY